MVVLVSPSDTKRDAVTEHIYYVGLKVDEILAVPGPASLPVTLIAPFRANEGEGFPDCNLHPGEGRAFAGVVRGLSDHGCCDWRENPLFFISATCKARRKAIPIGVGKEAPRG